MGLDESQFRPVRSIYESNHFTYHNRPGSVTEMVNFLVVDQPSAYNAIIGQPLMKKTNMVTTVYCLTVKFPTL